MLRLVTHGDLQLDEYADSIRELNGYGALCVGDSGVIFEGSLPNCPGHWYPSYPIGGPIMAAPLILAGAGVFRLLGFDAIRNHPFIEMQSASVFVALTAVLLFDIGRRTLSVKRACWLALIFAFSTPAFSTASRALWQHTPSIFLLTLTIHLLLRAETSPRFAAWAGLPVALSYTVRPTNAVFVLLFTLFVAVRHRKYLPAFLGAAAPVAVLLFAANLSMYRALLPPYYLPQPGRGDGQAAAIATAAAGMLFSPSRGLFVFTPLFLFAAAGMWRGTWRPAVGDWLRTSIVVYFAVIVLVVGPVSGSGNWWGGHSFGPRLLTDLTPIFMLFLIPYLERWDSLGRLTRQAFVTFALAGFAIHYRAAWSEAVWRWNVEPSNVDQNPARVMDWSDPQFLRFRMR